MTSKQQGIPGTTRIIPVPTNMLGTDVWGLLGYYGVSHLIRAYSFSEPRPAKDPSDHRLREIRVDTSVKWKPRDSSTIIFQDVPPLGPRR